jgi:hypothetical protein
VLTTCKTVDAVGGTTLYLFTRVFPLSAACSQIPFQLVFCPPLSRCPSASNAPEDESLCAYPAPRMRRKNEPTTHTHIRSHFALWNRKKSARSLVIVRGDGLIDGLFRWGYCAAVLMASFLPPGKQNVSKGLNLHACRESTPRRPDGSLTLYLSI